MRIFAWRLIIVLVCHLLVGCGLAAAQDAGGRATPAASGKGSGEEAARPRVEESHPPLYFLKDKSGNLQAVPGFTLEEFEELYKLKHQLAQQEQRPQYSIQRMTVQGKVVGDQAELVVVFSIQTRDETWVRVPLRLDTALLREAANYSGPGQHFLHFESDGEGYVSWIRGQPNQSHQITLNLLVPLTSLGDQVRMKFTGPRAVSSEMKLLVPMANAAAKTSERATVQQTVPVGAGTEFTVLGLSGDFEISWNRTDPSRRETPPVLECTGAILATIDPYGVQTEATLTVRSHAGPFDTFRVSLPPGNELVPGSPSGYTIAPVAGTNPQQPLVEVRLAKKTAGPVEVRVNSKRPPIASSTDQWTELAGFEVTGAARQSGILAVAAMAEVQVLWGPNRSVRQTEQVPDALKREDIAASFEFFSQPCSLTMRQLPKKTRIHIEPEYRLSVEADETRLDARLKYTIRGAKVFVLRVALPGWELDDVGPEQSTATDGIAVSDASVVTIPLLQPTGGPFELRIRAHRPNAKGASSLAIQLPQPHADSFGPAVVAVSPANNVELSPNSDSMKGLTREAMPPQLRLSERQQPPLFYRGDGREAVFAAAFRTHVRQISAAVESSVNLEKPGGEVEQTLTYSIAYEPIDSIDLLAPRALAHSSSLQILYQGKPLAPTVPPESYLGGKNMPVGMRIALPAPCIGVCKIVVRFPLKLPTDPAHRSGTFAVPLMMPEKDRLTGNKLSVRVATDVSVEASQGPWSVAENLAEGASAPQTVEMTSSERCSQIDLTLRRRAAKEKGIAVADRAWVQTWLTSAARQDRAVFRFTSDRKEISVFLPIGAAPAQATATLDGNRLAIVPDAAGRTAIALAGGGTLRQYVLELQYQFPDRRPTRGAISMELPHLGDEAWVRRTYWQLILPPDEYVIAAPANLTGECDWGWQRYFWGRAPLLEQADLETWAGAPRRPSASVSTNRYLFSTLGNLESCNFRTAQRSWVVLLASGTALALGLLLMYVPMARRPASLITGAILASALAVFYPEATLMGAQAALLGVVLAAITAALRLLFPKKTPQPAPLSQLRKSMSSGSRRTDVFNVADNAQPSTQTAPALAPSPDPNP